MAAFQLLEVVWQHINAISAIAELRPYGSHIESALVLCRVAFEACVTACWLATPDNWMEREAKWVRWVQGEETNLKRLATAASPFNIVLAEASTARANAHGERRSEIAKRLVQEFVKAGVSESLAQEKVHKKPNPSFKQILQESGLGEDGYLRYMVMSDSIHVAPSVASSSVRIESNSVTPYLARSPSEWTGLFEHASCCICQATAIVLPLCGATEESIEEMLRFHRILYTSAAALRNAYRI